MNLIKVSTIVGTVSLNFRGTEINEEPDRVNSLAIHIFINHRACEVFYRSPGRSISFPRVLTIAVNLCVTSSVTLRHFGDDEVRAVSPLEREE